MADKDRNSTDIIFKNRHQVAFEHLEGVDNAWEDPAIDEGVYVDADDTEDSDGDTSEGLNFDPNEINEDDSHASTTKADYTDVSDDDKDDHSDKLGKTPIANKMTLPH